MIKWSYSGLKDFTTCPRRYSEVRVKKNFINPDNAASLAGKRAHEHLESYVGRGTPLPTEYKSYEKYVGPLLEVKGTRSVELRLALCHDKRPTEFEAENYWVRGIIDLLILSDDTAYIVDYKTGNNKYADLRQMKLMSLLVFHHYEQIQKCKVGLLFLAYNDFIPDEYSREDIPKLWQSFAPDLFRLNMAFETDHWMPNPSGLCRNWCPVVTCEFNGKGR